MFQNGINEIKNLLSTFLGDTKSDSYSSQVQFCCPCCAEHKGVESDKRYNLEVNIEKGVYKCWVCCDTDGMSGKISNLIKKYGNEQILSEYYQLIKDIKESSLYSLYGSNKFDDDFIDDYNEVSLPIDFKYINKDDKYSKQAYNYLIKRGLNEYFIKTYNIGYVGYSKDYSMRNRIIIPSYNEYGELNYWVGRDYIGNSKLRYKNPNIEKKNFIFNEKFINWYDNVTLVEGVFDHIVVPNSIPLLGKTINTDFALYKTLMLKAKANVNIFLDDDAYVNALKLYKLLDDDKLKGRIRLIKCPEGFDASSIYENYKTKGILRILQKAEKIDEFDLLKVG